MSTARIDDFHNQMIKAGLYKAGEVDLEKVVTLQFVSRRVDMALKSQLGAQ